MIEERLKRRSYRKMAEGKKKKESGGISRREFLKDAGLFVGGAAVGSTMLLAACGGKDETSTESNITVLNPEGQPPPINLMPLAPRLDTIEGKTVYLVDIKFTATQQLLEELEKLLNERYPNTTIVLKMKAGSYAESDPELWNEIKEKGDAAIIALGH